MHGRLISKKRADHNSNVCFREHNGAIAGSFYLTLFVGPVSYYIMGFFAVQKTWQYSVELVDGLCSQICHRHRWLGACGLRVRDTASRCQLAWLCFIGSLVTAPFDGLISTTSMYQTGYCDYSNAAKLGRSYRSNFFPPLTVFYRFGLASTGCEDPCTNFGWNFAGSAATRSPVSLFGFVFYKVLSCTAGHPHLEFHLSSSLLNLWLTRSSLWEFQW